MILKRIEIYGFKSFGKKIEIDFNGSITGIVGPNGSGKSNIVDAIRWVLGEQRVKSLRGSKMEEVIFSGTQEKQALGYAQVSLILDNSSNVFPIEYEEISVTRRLFRSGESEYYLNKVLCRLKDIQELFMDTGLGREGYSIVGQGQIESIVNVSPYERKLLIEEAAGIVKYKVRKLEAERKLEKAQNNLYRITDIIAELDDRLPTLKKQAEKAEKFIEYKNELKKIEVNIFVHRMDKLKSQASKAGEDKNALEESLRSIDEQTAALDERYTFLKSQVGTFDAQITEINEKIHTLITNFENSKTEISVARSKVETNENMVMETSAEIGHIKNALAALYKSREEIINALSLAKQDYENKKSAYENRKSDAEIIGGKYKDGDKVIQKLRDEIEHYERSIDENQNKANELNTMIQNCGYIIEKLTQESQSLKEESEKNQAELNGMHGEDLKELESAQMQLAYCEKNKQLIYDSYENYKEELGQLFTKLQTQESRLKLLSGYENSMQGYRYGIRKLAEQKKIDLKLQKGLYGAVGELIHTDVKYSEAVTKALGGAMEYIVVENEDIATHCIQLLKEKHWGRITFLPKNIVKANIRRTEEDAVSLMKGFIDYADNLVKCESQFKHIIENLLGRVVVVDTIENAIIIANKTAHRNKLVTLGGEVLLPGGAMVGGKSKDDDEGVLKRRNEIEKLAGDLKTDKNNYEDKLLAKESYTLKMKQAQEQLNIAQEVYNQLKNSQGALLERFAHKKEQINSAAQTVSRSQIQIKEQEEKIIEYKKEVSLVNGQIASMQSLLTDARREVTKTSSGAYKEDYLNAVRLLNEAEIEMIKINESVTQWEERLLNIDEKINDTVETKDQKECLIEKCRQDNTLLREQIEYYTEIDKDYDLSRKELDTIYDALSIKKNKTGEEYINVNDKIIELNKERNSVTEQLNKVDVLLSRAEIEMEHLQVDMLEDYSLTYASAVEFKTEIADLNKNIAYVIDLKDKIRRLGNINVEALEEYKEVKERFENMTTQKEDLVTSKEELMKIIKDISAGMIHRFMQQYELIQKEFNDVFNKLFSGGEAHLVLTDPEDIMESGIDIIAQPPKTKLKNIAALSGGEKTLTAISLIFGILKIKPSPFCVLDEIDAALDDANALRFCEYLLSIGRNNQFVIITHKKKTMEIADILYGVAMGKDGITQTYSVKMSEMSDLGVVHA